MSSKHQKIYNQIVERARGRKLDCYSEWHHVLPCSLGGSDDTPNLVQLTYREHFLVHWLLIKMHVGKNRRAMVHAFKMMGAASGQRIVASWQYEAVKREFYKEFAEQRQLDAQRVKAENLNYLYNWTKQEAGVSRRLQPKGGRT